MKINYKAFEDELALRFNNMAHLVTEDLIRQWFIEKQKLTIKNTIIEEPYRELISKRSKFYSEINSRARVDLYYKGTNEQTKENEEVVIEFKYHKKVDRSTTCKTTNMGEVFRDLNRLSTIKNKEKYFIYVFDQEMKDYYDKRVFDILKVGTACGKTLNSIDIETLIKGKKTVEFKNAAFSPFDKNKVIDFNSFSYTVKMLYSNKIITYKTFDENRDNSIYMIILQVK